ncbi:MAG: copper resistance protein CopC [Nitrospirae bacterium]|nr:copper resistance protein CopC [Nitrospirota bacterium]
MKTKSIQMTTFMAAVVLLLGATPARTFAHAFPDHSDPRVGSTLKVPPSTVRIWFDGYLEPAFSTIEVHLDSAPGIRPSQSEGSKRVDQDNGHVDPSDPTLLEVSLPVLSPGKYRVIWAVVAVDGHRTEGNFSFTIEAAP